MLQAQLLGLLLQPATQLVRTLNEPAASLARVLQAIVEKAPAALATEAPSEPVSAVEVPVTETPASETPAAE